MLRDAASLAVLCRARCLVVALHARAATQAFHSLTRTACREMHGGGFTAIAGTWGPIRVACQERLHSEAHGRWTRPAQGLGAQPRPQLALREKPENGAGAPTLANDEAMSALLSAGTRRGGAVVKEGFLPDHRWCAFVSQFAHFLVEAFCSLLISQLGCFSVCSFCSLLVLREPRPSFLTVISSCSPQL